MASVIQVPHQYYSSIFEMENTVIALYSFVPSDDSQLKFVAGDELAVLQTDPSGWWYGESLNGSSSGWYDLHCID